MCIHAVGYVCIYVVLYCLVLSGVVKISDEGGHKMEYKKVEVTVDVNYE